MKKNTLKKVSAFFTTAIMMLSCGSITSFADNSVATMTLTDSKTVAGETVTVDLVLNTDNRCAGYNIDVEFDEDLVLKNVEGVFSTCTIDNVVTLVNLTGTYFKDDTVVSTLTFEVPKDAEEGEEFNVRVSRIGNFCDADSEFENVSISNSTIEVLEADKPITNNMVFVSKTTTTTTTLVALRGDINGDGKVNLYDAILAAQSIMSMAELDEKQSFFANVDENGSVDLFDASNICKLTMTATWKIGKTTWRQRW
jgi:hypothetical protein